MVNIAMIGHKRIPSREGGIEIVVDELATRMAAKGHKVIAYNRKGHNVAGAEFDGNVHSANKPFVYNGVRVVPVPTFEAKGLAALTSSFFATLKAIAAKPDVIHYHAEGPCVMLRLAHWAGIRTVATIHGLDWQRAKWVLLTTILSGSESHFILEKIIREKQSSLDIPSHPCFMVTWKQRIYGFMIIRLALMEGLFLVVPFTA